MLLAGIYLLAPTKEEMVDVIKVVVYSAAALFVCGIIEGVFDVRPFDALYTISRDVYALRYYRLGLLRATTTMYAPSFYGNMCILVFPLILYFYEEYRYKRYLLIAGLGVLAIIHSGARSDIFFLAAIIFVYLLMVLKDKGRCLLLLKNIGTIALLLVVYIGLMSVVSEDLRYYYVGTAKSVLNEIGFEYDLDEGAPSDAEGYGYNPSGSVSRTRQFTGAYLALQENPLFGYGTGATFREEVQYYWRHKDGTDTWTIASTYDVGAVEILCEEGLLGFIGICFLMLFLFLQAGRDRYKHLALLSYLLASLSTRNMYAFIMFYVVVFIFLSEKVHK